jgi:hypothetical protein
MSDGAWWKYAVEKGNVWDAWGSIVNGWRTKTTSRASNEASSKCFKVVSLDTVSKNGGNCFYRWLCRSQFVWIIFDATKAPPAILTAFVATGRSLWKAIILTLYIFAHEEGMLWVVDEETILQNAKTPPSVQFDRLVRLDEPDEQQATCVSTT